MGIFDSFRKKKPKDRSREMKPETPPGRRETAPRRWQVGDKIEGRYEIHQILGGPGRSGMGIVYIALDHKWNEIFAIKTFQDSYLRNEDAIGRFTNETLTWINLEKHTNVVCAHWVEKIKGKPYIFLEYVDGGDLSQYVGKVDVTHALDFAIQFCNGMDYANKEFGVIHRDIKPQNAMITVEGTLKVTDFGLAKAVGQRMLEEELELGPPSVSRGMGTWPYMPPEQFPEGMQRRYHFPSREVTTRSDIYSFGATFYQVITGSLPFATVEQIFIQIPTNPQSLNPHVPAQLDSLLMKCLNKNPDDRYESFEQLIRELVEICSALSREQKVFGEEYVIKGKKEPLTAKDLYNRGFSLGNLGRRQEAIVYYDEALQADPSFTEALINKGLALGDLGRPKEAIICYDKAIKIDPRDADAWHNKGVALRDLEEHAQAVTCFEKAMELNPEYVNAYVNKGLCLAKLGRHKEGITYSSKALEIDPENTYAWNNKGNCLLQLGRYQDAILCFDRALELDTEYAEAWNNKGLALVATEKHREAIDCFSKALAVNPGLSGAWLIKAILLQSLEKYYEAIECYKKFVELAPAEYASEVQSAELAMRLLYQMLMR